jgi:hypothetical protein
MIVDEFDNTTIANLKEALERTAELFPERLSDHRSRSWLARSLLEIAKKGQTRIGPLTEAALCTAAAHFAMPDELVGRVAAAGPHARAELTDYEKTPGCGMLATEDDTNPCPTS